MSLTMDCYAVLEVPPDASTVAIRAAFRRLAQEWHPDRNPASQAEANRHMSEINLAWEILKSPETRRMYDEARASGSQWLPAAVNAGWAPRSSRSHGDVPPMTDVDSGCVRRIGHNGLSELYIEFRTGGLYVYRGVPVTVYRALLHAKSKSRFVIYNIVSGPYLCKRIGA